MKKEKSPREAFLQQGRVAAGACPSRIPPEVCELSERVLLCAQLCALDFFTWYFNISPSHGIKSVNLIFSD